MNCYSAIRWAWLTIRMRPNCVMKLHPIVTPAKAGGRDRIDNNLLPYFVSLPLVIQTEYAL